MKIANRNVGGVGARLVSVHNILTAIGLCQYINSNWSFIIKAIGLNTVGVGVGAQYINSNWSFTNAVGYNRKQCKIEGPFRLRKITLNVPSRCKLTAHTRRFIRSITAVPIFIT